MTLTENFPSTSFCFKQGKGNIFVFRLEYFAHLFECWVTVGAGIIPLEAWMNRAKQKVNFHMIRFIRYLDWLE